MRLTYKLEKEDYLEFNLTQMKNFPKIRKSVNIQRFIMPLMFTLFILILSKLGGYSLKSIGPIYLIMVGAWILFYPKILEKSMLKRLNKALDTEENKYLLSERTIEVNSGGIYEIIQEEDGSENSIFAADRVIKLDENAKHLYIFLATEAIYLIPKKYFKSEEEEADFKEDIRKLIV